MVEYSQIPACTITGLVISQPSVIKSLWLLMRTAYQALQEKQTQTIVCTKHGLTDRDSYRDLRQRNSPAVSGHYTLGQVFHPPPVIFLSQLIITK